jgi:hypothetical protein
MECENIKPLSKEYDDNQKVFELGKPTTAIYTHPTSESYNELVAQYPIVDTTNRLRIKHQSTDFFSHAESQTENPLNYGLLMHSVLNEIRFKSDQDNAIARLVSTGKINQEEALIIQDELKHFWELPHTHAWFDSQVQVLNETTILTPEGVHYRPDRVVIKDNKATIIDYKFGDIVSKSHVQQVRHYMHLISLIGYQTEGFICYVTLRKVEKVA